MITLTIDTNTPEIASKLRRLPALLAHPKPLLQAAGEQLAKDLRAHFTARDKQPNAKGWPKRHFWANIARATSLTSVTDDSAEVVIDEPAINLKVYGGTVTPKRGKYLAIPAIPEAYQAGSPRELPTDFLQFVPPKNGKSAMLIERDNNVVIRSKGYRKALKRKGNQLGWGGRIWYYLARKTHHDPDPDALPPTAALETSIYTAITDALNRRLPL